MIMSNLTTCNGALSLASVHASEEHGTTLHVKRPERIAALGSFTNAR